MLKITTTIRNMVDTCVSDFATAADYRHLHMCESIGAEVTVVNEVMDGYYDLVLATGEEISAVSWYHLDGFNANGIEL